LIPQFNYVDLEAGCCGFNEELRYGRTNHQQSFTPNRRKRSLRSLQDLLLEMRCGCGELLAGGVAKEIISCRNEWNQSISRTRHYVSYCQDGRGFGCTTQLYSMGKKHSTHNEIISASFVEPTEAPVHGSRHYTYQI
jgi:hypothetical protein